MGKKGLFTRTMMLIVGLVLMLIIFLALSRLWGAFS